MRVDTIIVSRLQVGDICTNLFLDKNESTWGWLCIEKNDQEAIVKTLFGQNKGSIRKLPIDEEYPDDPRYYFYYWYKANK